ncbi:hypothetical protein FC695_11330, partial [Bacillus cereus]
MSRKDRFNSPKIKSEISISPDLVGPTGSTGPTFNINFRAEKNVAQSFTPPADIQVSYGNIIFNNG